MTKHQKEQSKERFSGFLKDYLEILELNLDTSFLAHKRLYDSITKYGITRMRDDNPRCRKLFNAEPLRTYDYFQDSWRWIKDGSMDLLTPMIYWNMADPKPNYQELVEDFAKGIVFQSSP